MLDINERNRVYGEEIHKKIESKNKNYRDWLNDKMKYADLKEGKDFFGVLLKSTGGRPKTQYEFTIGAAKEICLLERNEKGKQIRRWLIRISEEHEKGFSFTTPQIEALMDISKAMTLVSIQKDVARKHFNIYNEKETWYEYRSALLGYDKESLMKAMRSVNKKYRSMRASLIQLDADELIRTGVIDFMIAMGKSEEYAINVGNLCKSISKKAEFGNIIWDDTKENPLGINSTDINGRKVLFKKANELSLM